MSDDDKTTWIAVVLDRSGSMASVWDDTIGGFNAFLAEQQALPGEARLTLVQFDHEHAVVHDAVPIKDVPPLSRATYVPRGNTALYDAMGRTIVDLAAKLDALPGPVRAATRAIVVVLTDGQENASREFSKARVAKLIGDKRGASAHADEPAWDFVFLGADLATMEEAVSMGVLRSNAAVYKSSGEGTRLAVQAMSASVGSYRTGGSASVDVDSLGASPAGRKVVIDPAVLLGKPSKKVIDPFGAPAHVAKPAKHSLVPKHEPSKRRGTGASKGDKRR